ncbi:L-fuculose-phosphate aldolase [Photobacterium sanctipauli]|uniref:L-fuculose-phosphate aldolase n=1 Tax=Photobacterium sanctipauli TaxID=1342794 RepID=A0A2T3NX41_9GAMM|nr:L-fuculose-phosphate aldolase [Photobacterium sanctipauli]PSW20801.1 L-fuculose-phosphate aldolase [Photobacterium sanctipauli]
MNRDQLAQDIINTCIEMNKLGLNQGTAGNVSARYKEGMLITPSGIPYEKLVPEQIVYVTNEGQFESDKIPSSEWLFHLAYYKARSDINAVVHNHAVNSTAVSILNKPIPAIHYMVAASGAAEIPCVPYATFGSKPLADFVQQGAKQSKAILLQHHGMIAGEQNLEKALWLAHEVEVLAELYLKVMAITEQPKILDTGEMATVLEKFKTYGLKVSEDRPS